MVIWLKINIIVAVLLLVLIFSIKTVIASLKTQKERLYFKFEYNGLLNFVATILILLCVSSISLFICFIWSL